MKLKRTLALFGAMLMLAVPSAASANSAQRYWQGGDTTGALLTEDCPLVVDREVLTFDIREFPNIHASSEGLDTYSGSVAAEYTFLNPTDQTVTAKLVFPFGSLPGYADTTATECYGVTVDGEEVEVTFRHTLFEPYDDFELERDLNRLGDEFMAQGFFTSPDMPVWRYEWVIDSVDTEAYPAARAALDIASVGGDARIFIVGQTGFRHDRIFVGADEGQTLTVYVFGSDFAELPEWKLYQDGGVEDGEEIDGSISQTTVEITTLRDVALSAYDAGSGVSETDWYNAVVASLVEAEIADTCVLDVHSAVAFDVSGRLMNWYEYDLTVGAGETVINTVTAPIYPSVDEGYDPAVYTYEYLLSPASCWAEFRHLTVNINTPFYMTECVFDGFTSTETGYTMSFYGLPSGELEFDLCADEDPRLDRSIIANNILFYLSIIGVVLLIAAPIVITIVIVLAVIRKKNKKQHTDEQ